MDAAQAPFAPRLAPPYFVASFSYTLSDDPDAENAYAGECFRLAARSPDFLGAERARSADGFGITLVFWRRREAIETWVREINAALHETGYRPGDREVFDRFALRVAHVAAEYWPEECRES